ncbi:type II secretion system GspH family protein [Methylobacillus arboreus]|uniref:type II secretion system protein n=1 Tax=Methylobacillus arboreus TaxID=755170 RepID=UPI001E3E3054|nr:prepilin-type N-terminal cleavage/methylation domain-containing protein [Methylobacillus arboreus]MCB5190622.1 type II secretion system GspH family protein [Methylobacillus arboreus]
MVMRHWRMHGFTLVELLVVMAILMLLLTIAAPRYFSGVERAKEAALKQTLHVVRDAIDKFHADNARYPDSLEELAERKYIRAVPVDPITESNETWQVVAPEEDMPGEMYDLYSGAEGQAADGSLYAEW